MRRRIVSFILTVAAVQPWLAFAAAGEPTFRRHDINPDSTYCACAAVDVNRDGRLDIVCGGWWYEAPTWKKHLLRDVPMIGGRYDDYSNLPLDVNGDGWIDLVSANYRSETLFWIENPGKRLGPWPAHVIAKPGPMETARLEDIDGDGQLDVLPNGMQFAAWWEVVRGPKALTPGPSPADGRGELNGFAFSLRHALAPGPDSLSMGAPPKGRQECLPSASGRGEFRVPATGRTGDCQNRLLTNSNVGVGPQAPGGKFPLRALTPLRGGA